MARQTKTRIPSEVTSVRNAVTGEIMAVKPSQVERLIIFEKKELHEERECFDCGKQFIPPQYESMKDSRCCEACAQFA